jgi:hypothetical protein
VRALFLLIAVAAVVVVVVLSHFFSPTGRLTGRPIGWEDGRAVKRAWEAAAAAMPQPLSNETKEALRTLYVQGYAAIGWAKSRSQATEAVKNLQKKASGQISVRRRATCLPVLHHVFLTPPTGRVHEANPSNDSIRAS